jgi:hypothetical protein
MMKNVFFAIVFVGILFFLPAHLTKANITNPDFSTGDDGLDGWTVEQGFVSGGWPNPDGSSYGAAQFSPDNERIISHSVLSQVFTLDPGSQFLSFDGDISESHETGIFTAALLDGMGVPLVDSDGLGHFFSISSDQIPPNGNTIPFSYSLNVSGLAGQTVKLVFDLYNDYPADPINDTYALLYNLYVSTDVQIIPAPGAIVLVGIGVMTAGYLRRNKRL